jgi:hypothetical protein
MRTGTASVDLLATVRHEFKPGMIEATAKLLGENREQTGSAIASSAPMLLSALSEMASSEHGASHLQELMQQSQARLGGGVGDASQWFRDDGQRRDEGVAMLEHELGPRSVRMADEVARSSGIRPASAWSLLGFLMPLVLGAIGKATAGLGPAGLGALLRASHSARAADAFGHEPRIRGVELRRGGGGWLVPLLFACLALFAIFGLRGARHPRPPDGLAGLRALLDRPTAGVLPARFAVARLDFKPGTTELTSASSARVNELATVLNEHPTARIRLVSHSGDAGSADASRRLSAERSEALKGRLVSQGVGADRIETAGAEGQPSASPTAEGQPSHRGAEVYLLSR